MSELDRLQRSLATALVHAGEVPGIAPTFAGDAASVAERLAVYRGNVIGASTKALANAYAIVAKIVGAEFFEGLAREYLRRHPSTSGDLNALGAHFAGFVAEFPHVQDLPYLPDVARMEWLAHLAYYAPDDAPLDLARLAAVPPEAHASLRLTLAAGSALLESPWPLARIWEVHQDDYAGEFAVDLESGPDRILVHRPRFRVRIQALTPGEFAFLQRAHFGAPLAKSLEAALAAEASFDLAPALTRWVETRVICAFDRDARSVQDEGGSPGKRIEGSGT
jgi:uncharacterized protein